MAKREGSGRRVWEVAVSWGVIAGAALVCLSQHHHYTPRPTPPIQPDKGVMRWVLQQVEAALGKAPHGAVLRAPRQLLLQGAPSAARA